MKKGIILITMLLAIVFSPAGASAEVEQWARAAFETVQRDHAMDAPGAYYEDQDREDVAYTWGIAKLGLAYTRASMVDSSFLEQAEKLIAHQNLYWVEAEGIGGYDHLPHPQPVVERYYDDNAWVAMALIEIYNLTGKDEYLTQARDTIKFSLSGEAQGGGIYWREDPQESVNTCSVAPTAFACLGYYQITNDKFYLDKAKELMVWLDDTLQDDDHLYLDRKYPATGHIDRTKWTYNSGMPLQVYVRLYNITGEQQYLDKALAIAESSKNHWFDEQTGAISCTSMFAWTLVEGWVELTRATGDSKWYDLAYKSVAYVHNELRDENGRYPGRWDAQPGREITSWNLLHPAGCARALWVVAEAAQ